MCYDEMDYVIEQNIFGGGKIRMDIAALSTAMSQMQVKQQASLSVMKMTMDAGTSQATDMIQMMQGNNQMLEQAVDPNLGRMIDIKL